MLSCFRCGMDITSSSELSVEHKVPWLDSEDPVKLFFDLDNIAFSHSKCNSGAARSANRGKFKHPSIASYNKRGCRCDGCRALIKKYSRDRYWRLKNK